MKAGEISKLLQQRTEEIVPMLLPKAKKLGEYFHIGNTAGDEGKSLKISLKPDKLGLWSDFNTGEAGDILELWRTTRNITLSEAIKEAKNFLGIKSPCFEKISSRSFKTPQASGVKDLIPTSAIARYLENDRKIPFATLEKYKIGEKDGSIVFKYFRESKLVLMKLLALSRPNGKKQIYVTPNCEPCLFGWEHIDSSSREVILTEGELDAISLNLYGYSALSVPFGGGKGKKQEWLEYEFDRLAIFDTIYLCFDNDTSGNEAVTELVKRLGQHRCKIIELPFKDPNECLQNNVTRDVIKKCIEHAKSLDPVELKSASLFLDEVTEQFYPKSNIIPGYLTPWEKTKNIILFRPEELSIWTGINGHGKSQILGQIILSNMQQGAKVCIASLELKPKRLLMRMAKQACGTSTPDVNSLGKLHEWYSDKLWLFNLVGTAKTERILEVFLYARQRYGTDIFVIDSLMKLDIAEDDYRAQKAFIDKLCDFKNEYNCHIHIVVHPRKSQDESKAPGKLDNKGTGAISDLADNCYSVWRNKAKEAVRLAEKQGRPVSNDKLKLLEQPDCVLTCDKQRNGDWEGKIGLWYDQECYQYLNSKTQQPSSLIA